MILNNYIITYLVCSFLSLFVGLVAAVNGFQVWRRWDITSQEEEQYRLEKRVYLIITLLSLGLILRFLMVPLWFWTLHSMIISIPGAMCLVGVHNTNAPLSYIASGLKLVMLPLYGYWLFLNYLDRKVVKQPFMKQKTFQHMARRFVIYQGPFSLVGKNDRRNFVIVVLDLAQLCGNFFVGEFF